MDTKPDHQRWIGLGRKEQTWKHWKTQITKTNVIKTHFGYWDIVFGILDILDIENTNTVASDYTMRHVEWIISSINLLDMWFLPGHCYWVPIHQSPQQSLCWGDDPPTIRNTRNLHPGTRSRIEKHEIPTYCTNLHNSWLLHLGVFLYLCIARSFGGNANSWFSFPMFRLKTKTNPSPLGRLEKTLKIMETSLMNPI